MRKNIYFCLNNFVAISISKHSVGASFVYALKRFLCVFYTSILDFYLVSVVQLTNNCMIGKR